jgi:hypothetical protein
VPNVSDLPALPQPFTPAAALAAGWSRHEIERAVRQRALVRLRKGTVAGLVTAAGAAPVAVRVQITAAALAGLSQEPAELDGYGPIPAWYGRLLAAGGTDWQVAVTDGPGRLLDLHPLRYQPTARQRAYVTARDRTCASPNCTREAARCDLDHVVPFDHDHPEAGGRTEVDNLCPLCRVHHNLKTWWNFSTAYAEDGTLVTVTPLGRVYHTPPPLQPCAP